MKKLVAESLDDHLNEDTLNELNIKRNNKMKSSFKIKSLLDLKYHIGDVLLLNFWGTGDASKEEMIKRIISITETYLPNLRMKKYVVNKLYTDLNNFDFSYNYDSVRVRNQALLIIDQFLNGTY